MSGYGAQLVAGRQFLIPRTPRVGRCGVVYHHGAISGAQPESSIVSGNAQAVNASAMMAAIAGAGIPVVAGNDGGGAGWATDAVVGAGGTADQDLTALAALVNIRTDKAIHIGESMGSYTVLRYMQTQPSKVAAAVVTLPLCNMNDFYTVNPNTVPLFQAGIASAWGVTAGAALPARAYIENYASTVATGGPILGFYSTVDAYMTPSYEAPWAAAINTAGGHATYTAVDSTYGHDDRTIGEIDDRDGSGQLGLYSKIVKFLLNNGA